MHALLHPPLSPLGAPARKKPRTPSSLLAAAASAAAPMGAPVELQPLLGAAPPLETAPQIVALRTISPPRLPPARALTLAAPPNAALRAPLAPLVATVSGTALMATSRPTARSPTSVRSQAADAWKASRSLDVLASVSASARARRTTRKRSGTARERAFACALCGSAFTERFNLNKHIRAVHERRRPFECPTCHARFQQRDHMQKHEMCVHRKLRQFSCGACGAAFGWRGVLKKHRRSSACVPRQPPPSAPLAPASLPLLPALVAPPPRAAP